MSLNVGDKVLLPEYGGSKMVVDNDDKYLKNKYLTCLPKPLVVCYWELGNNSHHELKYVCDT